MSRGPGPARIAAGVLAAGLLGGALFLPAAAFAGDCSGPSDCAAIADNANSATGLAAGVAGALVALGIAQVARRKAEEDDKEEGGEHVHHLAPPEHEETEHPLQAVLALVGPGGAADPSRNIAAGAGYVARAEDWDRFSDEWRAVLDDPAWPSRVTEFRPEDCERTSGEFAGWSPEQCAALVRRLTEVLLNPKYATLEGFGGCVFLADLAETGASLPAHLREEAGAGEGQLLPWLMAIPLSRAQGEHMEVTLDDRPEQAAGIAARLESLHEPQWADMIPALRQPLGAPVFRSSRDFPPLQAAAVLAYYTQRRGASEGAGPASAPGADSPAEAAVERLIAGKPHYGVCLDRAFYAEVARRHREGASIADVRPADIYRGDRAPDSR